MSYSIAAISNGGGAPEQAYRKMQSAGACPERPLAGTSTKTSAIILGTFSARGLLRSSQWPSVEELGKGYVGVL